MKKKVLQMSQEPERFLEEVEKDMAEGKNFAGPFSSAEEMDEYLTSV